MTPRPLFAFLGLMAAACVTPPTRYELASSAHDGEAGHACCLHPLGREVEPWGREMLGAERVNREFVSRENPARPVAAEPRPALDLGGPPARPSAVETMPSAAPARDEAMESPYELEQARRDLAQARRALAESNQASEELTARVAELRRQLEERTSENQALAARLVQAQTRRLEAEKLLLEHQIQAERARLGGEPRTADR